MDFSFIEFIPQFLGHSLQCDPSETQRDLFLQHDGFLRSAFVKR